MSQQTKPLFFVCMLQCGRWCSRQRGGRLCGPQRRLQLRPSDPQRRARPRPPWQPTVRTHLPTWPPTAPPTKAPALAVYPPQTGRGGSHQALPLPVRELWALIRPTGQAGKKGGSIWGGFKCWQYTNNNVESLFIIQMMTLILCKVLHQTEALNFVFSFNIQNW